MNRVFLNRVLFIHSLTNGTDNRHQDGPTNSTARDLTDDGADVERTAARRRVERWHQRSQDLPADSSANDPRNGIARSAKIEILGERADNIAADSPADELDDQCDPIHDSPPFCFFAMISRALATRESLVERNKI
ncbi:MAG: hypothetical protein JO172_03610 [Hyphomicrobiales bacterium]|nr:hypothetical protein [Hyphomicrobiales bacterium]